MWQVQILQFLESTRTDVLTMFMTTITMMSESFFLVTIMALLYWFVDKIKSKRLIWIILTSGVVNGFLKNMIQMPRPFQKGVVVPLRPHTATSYSFPSGHTQAATSFWGGSMSILRTKAVTVLGTIFIILTAFSRLYLGVHWPMDVIGGILAGVFSILLANKLLDKNADFKPVHIIGTSIVLFIVVVWIPEEDLLKTISALWAAVLGFYIEQKKINFVPQQPIKYQIIKLIIGTVTLVLIYMLTNMLFPKHLLWEIVQYIILVLWISAGAPYLFKNYCSKK